MSELLPVSGSSPFDRIRHVRADGSEYWMAREVGSVMGYANWQNMREAVARAMAACVNSGSTVDSEFSQVVRLTEVSKLGTVEREDYELSRYASYLVAMNGDPRKSEVARAQAYFAIQTRVAEVTQEAAQLPKSFAEALQLAADQALAIERHAAQIAADAPKVQGWSDFLERESLLKVEDIARAIGTSHPKLRAFLQDQGILLKRPKNAPRADWVRSKLAVVRLNGYVTPDGLEGKTTLFTAEGVRLVGEMVRQAGITA